MEWLITAILGALIIVFIYWKASSHSNYWKKRGIPHVKPLPILGNTLDLVLVRKTFAAKVCEIYQQLDGHKYGGYMQFTNPVLIIRDPELINHVLIKDFNHFHDRGIPTSETEPLTASLVNLTGDRWRNVRHKLTPAFTSGKLKMMFNQIVECTDDAINFLKDKKDAIEVKQYMQKYNLNVIGLVAFGLNVDALNCKNEKSNMFVKQSTRFFSPSIKSMMNFMIQVSFPKLFRLLRLRTMDPAVTDFFVNLINDTIEYRVRCF